MRGRFNDLQREYVLLAFYNIQKLNAEVIYSQLMTK